MYIYIFTYVCKYIYIKLIHRMDEPPLHDIQSVNPDGIWVLIILVPTLLMVHRTILKECGMPTCKRSIMPKTCMLHEATWKHVSNSNPCAHWFCWPRFPLAPRAPFAPPLLRVLAIRIIMRQPFLRQLMATCAFDVMPYTALLLWASMMPCF
jgi:hypothetical protein